LQPQITTLDNLTKGDELAESFKEGDVVQLKSGGPHMTVVKIGTYAIVGGAQGAQCVWFDKTKQEKGVFALSNLNKIE